MKNIVLEARNVWKGTGTGGSEGRWVLRRINIKIAQGDFIAILGAKGEGKTTLLRVLGFHERPDEGEVLFEGRIVGRGGEIELERMRTERVWLVEGRAFQETFGSCQQGGIAAVLLDEPLDLSNGVEIERMFERISELNGDGLAVVLATSKPEIAAHAGVIYKLQGGVLAKVGDISTV